MYIGEEYMYSSATVLKTSAVTKPGLKQGVLKATFPCLTIAASHTRNSESKSLF